MTDAPTTEPHAGMAVIRSFLAESGVAEGSIDDLRGLMGADGQPAPESVSVSPESLGGQPAEWLVPHGLDRDRVVLYLHGGGYCAGSPGSHRGLAGRVALATGAATVALDYRLGPEHPFPAAVDDAVAAYRALLADGTDAASIAVAGDSAGGGLTLALALALRQAGEPLPAALACLSPWVDLTQSAGSYTSRAAADPMVTKRGLDEMAAAYLAGADPRQDLVSPRFADLAGLPPLRIDVGADEVLFDDAAGLAEAARAAGVPTTLVEWPEMIHVFQVFPGDVIPESDQSIAAIGAFLGAHLARPEPLAAP